MSLYHRYTKSVLSLLILSILSACGGKRGTGNIRFPLHVPNISSPNSFDNSYMPFEALSPAHLQLERLTGQGVRVGVVDDGFERDNKMDHPTALFERGDNTITHFINYAPSKGAPSKDDDSHGAEVARVLAGKNINDGFNPAAGLAPKADLYLAHQVFLLNKNKSLYSKTNYDADQANQATVDAAQTTLDAAQTTLDAAKKKAALTSLLAAYDAFITAGNALITAKTINVTSILEEEGVKVLFQDFYDKGVKIINHSYSMTKQKTKDRYVIGDAPPKEIENGTLQDAYSDSVNNKDQLHIWANGNANGVDAPTIIAGLPYYRPELQKGWITVRESRFKYFGFGASKVSYGNACGEAANWCLTANVPDGLYGSSFAAPAVAGTAALVSEAFPWMSNSEIRQTILSSTGQNSPDKYNGWGLLNPQTAVQGPKRFDTRLTLGGPFIANVGHQYDATFSNNISGNAGLLKQGDGILRLTGNNNYYGDTAVEAGTLQAFRLHNSALKIQSGATLLNHGYSLFHSIDNAGIIRVDQYKAEPKRQQLQIEGAFIAESNSELQLAAGVSVKVGGIATIKENAKLQLLAPGEDVSKPERVILKASKVRGKFEAVDNLLTTTTLRHNGKEILSKVSQKDVLQVAASQGIMDKSRRASVLAVKSSFVALDAAHRGEESLATPALLKAAQQVLSMRSGVELAATADSISGQIHVSSQALAFQQSQVMNRTLTDRIDLLSHPDATTGAWMKATGASGKIAQSGFATGATNTMGAHIGIDHHLAPQTLLGIATSLSKGEASFNRYSGKSRGESMGLSLYGRQGEDTGFYGAGRLGYERTNSIVKRDIVLRSDVQNFKSERRDYMLSAYGEIGHIVTFKESRITPFIGLSWDKLNRGNIAEDGHVLGLQAASQSYDQSAATFGMRFASPALNWSGGVTRFNAYGSYRYGAKVSLDFNAHLTGNPGTNTLHAIKGIALQQHNGWFGLGVETAATHNISWNLNYNMQAGRGGINNQLLSAGLAYRY